MADDNIELDLSSIAQPAKTAWAKTKTAAKSPAGQATITIALILIPLLIGLAIRLQPLTQDNIDRIATQSVNQQLQQRYAQELQQQNPGASPNQIRTRAQEELQRYQQNNPDAYQSQIDSLKDRISDTYEKPNGEPYLIAIDPYFYWRTTQNIMENGHPGDELRNGTPWNTHRLAPLGSSQGRNLHSTLAGTLGPLIGDIANTTLYMVFFTLPAVIASLGIIPAYFLGRYKGGRLGGFITAGVIASHQIFVSRSVAGFSDTDAYNVTLPLFIAWTTIKAFDADTPMRRYMWGLASSASVGLFAYAWQGWWLTYIFLAAATGAVLVQGILRRLTEQYTEQGTISIGDALRDKDSWSVELAGLTALVGSGFAASLSKGVSAVPSIFGKVLDRLAINQAAKSGSLWPNVFTTVAELGDTSLSGTINSLGSPILFYLALVSTILFFIPSSFKDHEQKLVYGWYAAISAGLLSTLFLLNISVLTAVIIISLTVIAGYTITCFEHRERINVAYGAFITAWLVSTLYASLQGTRFTMILMPAYAILLGTGFGWAFKTLLSYRDSAETRDGRYFATTIAAIVLLLGLLIPYTTQAAGWQVGQRTPAMNDAWYNSLKGIQNQSSDDAIITSWWDFGHWFKQVADRPVTFDGGSQNTPNAHWVGKALQTDSPDRAKSILRMLHCGNKKGFSELRRSLSDNPETPEAYLAAKQVIDDALRINTKAEATTYYQDQGLTGEQASSVASLTHCQPPENYLITSDDMVGKASVWGHFGLWDFDRAYANSVHDQSQPKQTVDRIAANTNVSRDQAQQWYTELNQLSSQQAVNQWIAAYPSYATNGMQSCTTTNQTISCDVNLQLRSQGQQEARLEQIVAPEDNPANTSLIVGLYNAQTEFRQGQRRLTPSEVAIGESGDITEHTQNGTTRLGVFLHQRQDGSWEALLGDPAVTTSMFTRLYYLDGAYTEDFTKVSDKTSQVAGNRIAVWQPDLT